MNTKLRAKTEYTVLWSSMQACSRLIFEPNFSSVLRTISWKAKLIPIRMKATSRSIRRSSSQATLSGSRTRRRSASYKPRRDKLANVQLWTRSLNSLKSKSNGLKTCKTMKMKRTWESNSTYSMKIMKKPNSNMSLKLHHRSLLEWTRTKDGSLLPIVAGKSNKSSHYKEAL